jgi:hypothetical protein
MYTTKAMVAAGLVALAAATAPAAAQDSKSWEWNGTLAEGRAMHVHNVNGRVEVRSGTGDRVEVRAEIRWRRGDPDDVRLEAKTAAGGDVVVCAMWRRSDRCEVSGLRGNGDNERWDDRNDVSVHFTVTVPAYANVDVNTVNGDVTIEPVRGWVEAHSVNGDIEAASRENSVRARTVNGSITARGTLPRDGLDYNTVNGSIEIVLPADANADVSLRTTNGRVTSDFPITFTGDINPRRIDAQLGSGGPEVRARTVNGQIRLRKQ